ncbi:MAG TPA: hypothetical protein VJ911_08700 [Cryomorphaceae bacterium]|nr:hypothetical protein [Cryomorphaceae bacterium]
MRKFILEAGVVLLVSYLSAWIISIYLLKTDVAISFWVTTVILFVLNIVSHRFLLKANKKRPQIFVASFMGALTAKLFLSAILLIVVGVTVPSELKFTAIGYFIVYALLTGVDIKNLLPYIRSSNN